MIDATFWSSRQQGIVVLLLHVVLFAFLFAFIHTVVVLILVALFHTWVRM